MKYTCPYFNTLFEGPCKKEKCHAQIDKAKHESCCFFNCITKQDFGINEISWAFNYKVSKMKKELAFQKEELQKCVTLYNLKKNNFIPYKFCHMCGIKIDKQCKEAECERREKYLEFIINSNENYAKFIKIQDFVFLYNTQDLFLEQPFDFYEIFNLNNYQKAKLKTLLNPN